LLSSLYQLKTLNVSGTNLYRFVKLIQIYL